MTVDNTAAVAPPSSGDRKLQMHLDNHSYHDNEKYFQKARRLFQTTSFLYPILLSLLLIVGTTLLVITVTRRNTCRQLEISAGRLAHDDHTVKWVPCVKINRTASCVCPASFVHSFSNPGHCLPSHSRCLQSCHSNVHCVCHNLMDAHRCREVTRHWIEKDFQIGTVEPVHPLIKNDLLHHPWSDQDNRQVERALVNTKAGERLFFSADRRTGITIHEEDDDYLLNERWTKIETNTTQQHVVYSQLNAQTHSCRMSSINEDGTVVHGSIHTCPGSTIGAPYFLGVACENILVLWHGGRQLKQRRQEGWAVSRHNFESAMPRLPVLLDPFHRYYSLYDDSMIEIKDLDGDVLAQLFTDIHRATRFEFIDQYGTMLVANQTHMQLLRSASEHAWLDM